MSPDTQPELTLRLITVAELPDLAGAPLPHPVLRCPSCGEEFSADRRDYAWFQPASHAFTCDRDDCDEAPLQLVIKGRAQYTPYVPDQRS